MADNQHTLAETLRFEGIGLHTGESVILNVLPAPAGHGYIFCRTDLPGRPLIPADAHLVVSTDRGTTLEKDGIRIHTTEHLLAALYGCGIDNALIELSGQELPILDGSSRIYVEGIEKAGAKDQGVPRDYLIIKEPVYFKDEKNGIELKAVPADDFKVDVTVDYGREVLGTQEAKLAQLSDFSREIAGCRTFCFFSEIEVLAKRNLIKGGDLDNAIVLMDRDDVAQEEIEALGKLLDKELKVKPNGLGVLNCELHFDNEPARHKLLDVIGDLALVGKPIKGHILANRPGHASNVELAKNMKDTLEKKEEKVFDPTKPAIYDINMITSMLPHRYPFLLVDKIIDITEESITGVKQCTMNEPHFQGHFPGNPVMPGVLQIEAMAQCGGIFALGTVEDPHLWSTYFLKIDGVKFKRKVLPGDSVVLHLELLSPIRRGIVHMQGSAYVDNELVSEAEMKAQIVKEREE